MDFFLPTAWEVPNYETDFTVTPSPHHPIGAKRCWRKPSRRGGALFFKREYRMRSAPFGNRHTNMAAMTIGEFGKWPMN